MHLTLSISSEQHQHRRIDDECNEGDGEYHPALRCAANGGECNCIAHRVRQHVERIGTQCARLAC